LNLKAQLEKTISRMPEAVGALIMDHDSLVVDKALRDESLELEPLFIEILNGLKNVESPAVEGQGGSIKELQIVTGDFRFLIHKMDQGYYLCLALTSGGNLGEGRYRLKRAAEQLAREFVV
jgi:predicted regulator of Ras-like GTPase activity (Roadblock/LC7/MglB family)